MYIEKPCELLETLNAQWRRQSAAKLLLQKVQRLTANHGVGSSDPKCRGSNLDRDIVYSLSKDKAVNGSSNIDDVELTTLHE